jgi:hypothetical protein
LVYRFIICGRRRLFEGYEGTVSSGDLKFQNGKVLNEMRICTVLFKQVLEWTSNLDRRKAHHYEKLAFVSEGFIIGARVDYGKSLLTFGRKLSSQ